MDDARECGSVIREKDVSDPDFIQKFAFYALKEQGKRRRWRLYRRLILLLIVIFFVIGVVFSDNGMRTLRPHVAVIKINGAIPGIRGNMDKVSSAIKEAFENDKAKGLIIEINSPGGSAVQSSYVYDTVRFMRKEHPNKKVFAVCSDICASGGYYIASSADEIYANPSSLVGSIGVIYSGLGLKGMAKKLGVESRVFTAGDKKDFMDPFKELNPEEVKHLKQMLTETHTNFISAVKGGRGDRLHASDKELFSGQIWTGQKAKTLGLVDGFSSVDRLVKSKFKDVDQLEDYTPVPTGWRYLFHEAGVSLVHGVSSCLSGASLRF